MQSWEKMVNMIVTAYIHTYGQGKWQSLTDKEKHDAVMFVINDLSRRIKNETL